MTEDDVHIYEDKGERNSNAIAIFESTEQAQQAK